VEWAWIGGGDMLNTSDGGQVNFLLEEKNDAGFLQKVDDQQ
jgi:hypothetical protein